MSEQEKPKPPVTVKFHKDVQLNGVLHKAGEVTEVPEDYWRTEGHRHGELANPPPPGVPTKKEVHEHAVQERRTEAEVPRDGAARGGQQEDGEGVRPGQQGQEATGAGDPQEDRGSEGLLSQMRGALKSKPKKESK